MPQTLADLRSEVSSIIKNSSNLRDFGSIKAFIASANPAKRSLAELTAKELRKLIAAGSAQKAPAQTRRSMKGAKSETFSFGFADEPLMFDAFEETAKSLAFWIRQIRTRPCPQCRAIGAVAFHVENHGVTFECRRFDAEACDYRQEMLFEKPSD